MLVRSLVIFIFILTIIATFAITKIVIAESKPAVSTEDVQKVVVTFLTENPDVIVNSFKESQRRQAEKEAQEAEVAIKEKRDDLEQDKGTPQVGADDADIVIVKFSDYNCGYCKRVMPDLEKLLAEDKKVKLVAKDFPILGERSLVNSKAAIAVYKAAPEKWFEFHTSMLKRTPRNDEQLYSLVEKVGVDKAKVKELMNSEEVTKQIRANLALGQSIGVRGTPAFVVNGEFVRGAIGYDQFKELIRAARS